MARVRPFAAWRYRSDATDITDLTAPPYDVIDEPQRAAFVAGNPHNVVELELAEGPLDPDAAHGRYATAARTWDEWRADGTLAHDAHPAVYVLAQTYELFGAPITRKAFIVEVGLEPFEAGIILPHERTLPKALGDRFELIKATGANFSQVFGLFDDAACATDALFARIMATEPVATATDADGVTSTLWSCPDTDVADSLAAFMADRSIFIADGHHRYTTALAHRDLRRELDGEAPDAASEFVLMALVNMDDPDLVVLPYHRIADQDGEFADSEFVERLSVHFDVTPVNAEDAQELLDQQERVSFLFKTATGGVRLASLKATVDPVEVIEVDRTDAWKHLDVAILQELVLWPLLGIHPDKPATLDRLSFTKDGARAFSATDAHDVAFVLRPTGLDQLRAVSLSGETMPQKSTYFYPKLLSGLVFREAR